MADNIDNKRVRDVKIKLAESMYSRAEKYAIDQGMPLATWCAFQIGEAVNRKDNEFKAIKMAIAHTVNKNQVSEELQEKILKDLMPGIIQQLIKAEHQLGLDLGTNT